MDARVAASLAFAAIAVAAGAFVAAGGPGALLSTGGYQPVTATDAGPTARPGTGTEPGTASRVGTTAEAGTTPGTATDAPTTDRPSEPEPTGRTFDDGYERATVVVRDENGTRLGRLRVAIAETYRQKYTGLSKTERLPADRGMLFVYDEPGDHTYVMRGMSFGIDIVYVDSDGTITRIHHAPEPPPGADGESFRYPGYGQYVLEANLNWTTRHGVTVGDRVEIDRAAS